CPATQSYGAGDDGSPGAPNEACPIVVPAGKCLDGTTLRDLVVPQPGDLVISEIMPDPNAVADGAGEWFEVTVKKDVDVNGLEAGTTAGTPQMTISDTTCRRRAAGSRLVFAHGTDAGTNGGLPAPEATFTFGLANTGGSLFVGVGGALLDQVTWTSSIEGAARSLDPGKLDPTANDDAAAWCPATTAYGSGDLGTPGAPNPACLAANQCLDNGTPRAIVAPGAGDLVISEVLAGQTDASKDWFEVTVL